MKEMNRGQKENQEFNARTVDGPNEVQKFSHPSVPEKMLKDCTEAATEELPRKKIELGEVGRRTR